MGGLVCHSKRGGWVGGWVRRWVGGWVGGWMDRWVSERDGKGGWLGVCWVSALVSD